VTFPNEHKNLLQDKPLSLAGWFAEPLDCASARACALDAQQRLLTRDSKREIPFNLRLAESIYRFWSGQNIEHEIENLAVLLRDRREQALLALCFGQLLMARRLQPATVYLERGFALAAHLLEPEDYFTVLRRHELLRFLPLRAIASKGESLQALLNEARIIERLKGSSRRPGAWRRPGPDTLG